MINADNIYEILRKGERINLECKKAQSSLPNSIWETYSAFANTYGGIILLGVSENLSEKNISKRFAITGVDDDQNIIRNLWNTVNNKEKTSINLLKDDDVTILNIEGKKIITINVRQADYTVRPVYINNNIARGCFKRNHEGDYHCNEQEFRMLVRDANEAGNDRLVLENYTMDDIDPTSLEQYRIMFKTSNPEHIWNGLNNKDFLRQLGGYVVDRKNNTGSLTMAGLLMFGKGLPIRERFDNLRLDYIDRSNLLEGQRYSDRLTYDGTWENNLFNFLRLVIPKLSRNLPRPFNMEGILRVDDTLQHKAVREALTNAIIHADFMINGILKVEKYDDCFVLTNPGLLKLPISQIYSGGESRARNQRIQSMLRMIGYGENLGSGFPLILHAWDEKHWLKPELIEQPDLMQVKLVLKVENSLVPKYGTKDVVNNVVNNVVKDVVKELSDRQQFILQELTNDSTLSAEILSQKTNITLRTIQRDFQKLQSLGLIFREGGRKDGRWIVKQ